MTRKGFWCNYFCFFFISLSGFCSLYHLNNKRQCLVQRWYGLRFVMLYNPFKNGTPLGARHTLRLSIKCLSQFRHLVLICSAENGKWHACLSIQDIASSFMHHSCHGLMITGPFWAVYVHLIQCFHKEHPVCSPPNHDKLHSFNAFVLMSSLCIHRH